MIANANCKHDYVIEEAPAVSSSAHVFTMITRPSVNITSTSDAFSPFALGNRMASPDAVFLLRKGMDFIAFLVSTDIILVTAEAVVSIHV